MGKKRSDYDDFRVSEESNGFPDGSLKHWPARVVCWRCYTQCSRVVGAISCGGRQPGKKEKSNYSVFQSGCYNCVLHDNVTTSWHGLNSWIAKTRFSKTTRQTWKTISCVDTLARLHARRRLGVYRVAGHALYYMTYVFICVMFAALFDNLAYTNAGPRGMQARWMRLG